MNTRTLRLVVALCGSLSLLVAPGRSTFTSGTVYYDKERNQLTFVPGKIDHSGAAYGSLNQTVNETGWGELNIIVNAIESGISDDSVLMEAAGFLEGALTNKLIYYNYLNVYEDYFRNAKPEVVERSKEWYLKQRIWMEKMIEEHSQNDTLWYYANLVYNQFLGLYEGYTATADTEHKLDIFVFDFLNGNGDYFDISHVVDPSSVPDFTQMSKEDVLNWVSLHGHCSALIKLLPAYEDIFMGHSSWFIYSAMLRIYKHYNFVLNDKRYAAQSVSFSSYPAYLSSLDDFYIMSSGIVMLQTTNNIFNKDLYSKVTNNALLAWHRVRIANWLANGGEEWSKILQQYNSGTYNNQYMVIDLSKIKLKSAVEDNALWIVEQIPGYIHGGDQTPILREGYWASYNVPFYEDIFNTSGYPGMVAKYGPDMTHDLAPRAKIFRRDQGNVEDLKSYKYIMRYNDYKQDPYSEGNPMNSICSRGDLLPKPEYGGCYDSKVTHYSMAMQQMAHACNGPTHQGLPAFDWRNFPSAPVPHMGQSTAFNFSFVPMRPTKY